MNRRGFLAGIVASAGALALDPERALWVPGRKLISIPSGKLHMPDEVYGVGLDGWFRVLGYSERFAHLIRADGETRSFARGKWCPEWPNDFFVLVRSHASRFHDLRGAAPGVSE